MNGLVYLRGSPRDYDRWAQSGARGWSYEEVEPVFRRIERWTGAADRGRGTEGLIHVSEPRVLAPAARAFVDACLALGFPRNRDWNNGAPIEGAGPIPMILGSHPATPQPSSRPRTGAPASLARWAVVTRTAASPSTIPDAFPAVTSPSFLKYGLSPARVSGVVLGRGCSSESNTRWPFRSASSTGTISSANRPASRAALVRAWLAFANASTSARVSPYFSARFSAVSAIENPA